MSQQIKLNMLSLVDTREVKYLTEQYHVNRIIWKGCKAILNKLNERDPYAVAMQSSTIKAELKRTQNNMRSLRVMIWNTVKEEVQRVGFAQQTATTATQVDPQLVNTFRVLFDANPQLKAQVQALLAIIALQTAQQR